MRDPFYVSRTTPARSGDKRCRVFHWIGQTLDSCDQCGEPDFAHPYRPVYGSGRPDLFVKQYHPFLDCWTWETVKINERYNHERALHWFAAAGGDR